MALGCCRYDAGTTQKASSGFSGFESEGALAAPRLSCSELLLNASLRRLFPFTGGVELKHQSRQPRLRVHGSVMLLFPVEAGCDVGGCKGLFASKCIAIWFSISMVGGV